MHFYRESGFAAVGRTRPRIDAPADWLAWHFTTWANLARIVQTGELRADRRARPQEAVGDQGIKQHRMNRAVVPMDTPGYQPRVTVGDHVPFYFTPRSPMLRRVLGGNTAYRGDHTGLVMLGISIRTVIDNSLTWCVSNRNAASEPVQFSCDLGAVGKFIDFRLMTEFMWKKTDDDPDRPTRRAAELLILGQLPVMLLTHIVTSTGDGIMKAREALRSVSGTRHYEVQPCFLYQ